MNPNEEHDSHLKVNNNTLTKSEQDALLRSVLPSLNGQEGSPANTFTQSELHQLQKAVGSISVGPSTSASRGGGHHARKSSSGFIDIRDLQSSFQRPSLAALQEGAAPPPQDGTFACAACPNDGSEGAAADSKPSPSVALDWHGAPRLHQDAHLPRSFREQVRYGQFQGPTNGVCPGFLQCNLVVLPQGPIAFDFLLFCQRNPKACPLIEVCDVGSPFPSGVAPGADLRTDLPK